MSESLPANWIEANLSSAVIYGKGSGFWRNDRFFDGKKRNFAEHRWLSRCDSKIHAACGWILRAEIQRNEVLI